MDIGMDVLSAVAVILLILVPIHGGLYLGIRNENNKKRRLLRSYWQLRSRHGK